MKNLEPVYNSFGIITVYVQFQYEKGGESPATKVRWHFISLVIKRPYMYRRGYFYSVEKSRFSIQYGTY